MRTDYATFANASNAVHQQKGAAEVKCVPASVFRFRCDTDGPLGVFYAAWAGRGWAVTRA
jgi:hypothetical protein